MSSSELNQNNISGKSENLESVRARTEELIRNAVESQESILIDSPPSSGKTTSTFKIAREVEETIVYLTQREDLYDQAAHKCEENGCSYKVIPSPHRNCAAFDEDSQAYNPEAVSLYQLGISAAKIHAHLDLDCSPDCEYMQRWDDFESESVDVIIGHYKHAYLTSIVENRVVIIDEFPGDAFEREFYNADSMISRFLQNSPQMPYDDFLDLTNHQDDFDRFEEAYRWFERNGVGTNDRAIVAAHENNRYHTLAPFLAFSLLNMVNTGCGIDIPWFTVHPDGIDAGFEKSSKFRGLDRDRRVVFERLKQSVHVLTPPDLSSARGVVGLDGTPTKMMWDLATGEDFESVSVVDAESMNDYVRNILGVTIKQTNMNLKPYHGGHITPERDEGILLGVEVAEGQKPSLIAPKNALEVYQEAGILDRAKQSVNYARVLSSNTLKGETVGVIHGSPHPGDNPIKKWAGYLGIPVEGTGKGMDRTYGDLADDIYHHFVHNQVFQAILRFGRGESDATVYVNTAALPDQITPEATVRVELFDRENKRAIADHLREVGATETTVQDIEMKLDISESTIRRRLEDFIDAGLVSTEDQPGPHPIMYRWVA